MSGRREIEIGRTVLGRPIEALHLTPADYARPRETALLFGAIHGDEPLGVFCLSRLALELVAQPPGRDTWLIPALNLDGLAAGQQEQRPRRRSQPQLRRRELAGRAQAGLRPRRRARVGTGDAGAGRAHRADRRDPADRPALALSHGQLGRRRARPWPRPWRPRTATAPAPTSAIPTPGSFGAQVRGRPRARGHHARDSVHGRGAGLVGEPRRAAGGGRPAAVAGGPEPAAQSRPSRSASRPGGTEPPGGHRDQPLAAQRRGRALRPAQRRGRALRPARLSFGVTPCHTRVSGPPSHSSVERAPRPARGQNRGQTGRAALGPGPRVRRLVAAGPVAPAAGRPEPVHRGAEPGARGAGLPRARPAGPGPAG